MKTFRSSAITLLLATGLAAAQEAKPGSVPNAASAPFPVKTSATTEENPILKGAELRSEWVNSRNPFRFEVNESPAYAPERVEQMQVLGFSKMPDENGLLQIYAFVTKTTEGARVQGSKPETKVTRDVHVLRALPEKLDEETVTTEEQIEESSIALGSEQLWFVGVVQTNDQTLAIFVPDHAPYPIKEDDLRPFEMQDSLKDLHVRITKAGEKISAEDNSPRISPRPKSKTTPTKRDTPTSSPLERPIAAPAVSKPDQKPPARETPASQ